MSRAVLPSIHIALGLGLAAGFLSGLLGIGGGLVIGPVLVIFGVPMKRAFGSALAVVAPVAFVGACTEGLLAPEHLVFWAAGCLVVGGQLGVFLGSRWIRLIADGPLRFLFVGLMLFAAIRSFGVWGWPLETSLPGVISTESSFPLFLCCGIGVLAGICAALFGVGGGVVVVPGLVYLVGGFSFHQATATSLLAMVPTALVGVALALRDGRVQAELVWRLLPSALLGATLGVYVRDRFLAPAQLSLFFGLFLVFAALQVLRRKTR